MAEEPNTIMTQEEFDRMLAQEREKGRREGRIEEMAPAELGHTNRDVLNSFTPSHDGWLWDTDASINLTALKAAVDKGGDINTAKNDEIYYATAPGAAPTSIKGKEHGNRLAHSIAASDLDEATIAKTLAAIKALGADFTLRNAHGQNPLDYSITAGSAGKERIATLIGAGVPLSSTVLHTALNAGRPDLVATLLAAGADPQAKDASGKDASTLAFELAAKDPGKYTAAKNAITEAGDKIRFAKMLEDAGVSTAAKTAATVVPAVAATVEATTPETPAKEKEAAAVAPKTPAKEKEAAAKAETDPNIKLTSTPAAETGSAAYTVQKGDSFTKILRNITGRNFDQRQSMEILNELVADPKNAALKNMLETDPKAAAVTGGTNLQHLKLIPGQEIHFSDEVMAKHVEMDRALEKAKQQVKGADFKPVNAEEAVRGSSPVNKSNSSGVAV